MSPEVAELLALTDRYGPDMASDIMLARSWDRAKDQQAASKKARMR